MSILSSTSTGKNSVLDVYFFDKLGMIKCGGLSFKGRHKIPVLSEQNENLQVMYTLGAVFIYKNNENEFFYRGGTSSGSSQVKIFSRIDLLKMVKTDMEYVEQRLSKDEQDSSYILECYKKIYNNIKELIQGPENSLLSNVSYT